MDETLSVENQILLCCARREFDPGSLQALVDQAIDWEALLASARDHGLLPLLYERFKALDVGSVPPPIMARLKSAHYTSLLRNQRLGADLAEVVAALRQEGVEVIVLKGGALSRTVYPDPAQRPMADLDLMVRPGQMNRAGVVLVSLGFCLSASIPANMVPFQQRFGGGLDWLRSRGGKTTTLELKHNLAGVVWFRTAYSVDPDALWVAARPLALDGTPAWQLSAEDSLIHLCLHPPLSHAYASPFIGYADIDRVVTAAEGAPSWPRLVERAKRFGVKTAVYHGLQCTQRLLGTPVPSDVLDVLQPGNLHLGILHWLAPLDREAVLQAAMRRPIIVKRVLLYAALVDQIGAVGGMVQSILFPGDDWLSVRYALETRAQVRRHRLVHPWHVARIFLQNLDQPLIKSSLDQ